MSFSDVLLAVFCGVAIIGLFMGAAVMFLDALRTHEEWREERAERKKKKERLRVVK